MAIGCGIPDLQGISDILSGLVLLRPGPFTWREPALITVSSGESLLWAALFRQERRTAELALLDGRAIPLVGGITPEDVVQLAVAMRPGLPGDSVLTLTLYATPDVVVEPFLRRLDADFAERCRSILGLAQWPLVFPEEVFLGGREAEEHLPPLASVSFLPGNPSGAALLQHPDPEVPAGGAG